MLDGMDDKDVEKVKEKIEKVDHVCDVLWYDTFSRRFTPPKKFFLMIFTISSTQSNLPMMAVFFGRKRPPLTAHLKLSRR